MWLMLVFVGAGVARARVCVMSYYRHFSLIKGEQRNFTVPYIRSLENGISLCGGG